ncbi:lysozyme inhibitor LprI family protein [Kosakonia quasisacchari]|uniref:Lysozyme inhibitor LprI family protein n=1 Tax=Kosakonia quasisacchari TaxID=2529380 RepID=A0A4R0GML7_9ENTR|nr:lysozyme inhibitor LprI family protein [Kosakonia quasisacchari]TCB98656.1 lysozyme inhibitor LprI family protein [Kosakonia quasisacchari]
MKTRMLALATLLLSSPVLADECDNASTQAQLNSCTASQYQAADKKLNQTYQAALKRSTPPQAAMLKKAQQSWITLRDSDCAFVSSGVEGGSAQPMVQNQCLTDKTNEREAWLASLLQCGEGDLSCPLPPGH